MISVEEMAVVGFGEVRRAPKSAGAETSGLEAAFWDRIASSSVEIGPLWMGEIGNKNIIKQIIPYIFKKQFKSKYELLKLLELLKEESKAKPFFYSSDEIASKLKKSTPKLDYILKKLNQKGYNAIKTHFSDNSFKTNAPFNEIKNIFIKKEKN